MLIDAQAPLPSESCFGKNRYYYGVILRQIALYE